MYVYMYICIYVYVYICIEREREREREREGTKGVPRNGVVVSKNWSLIVVYSQFFTCTNPHVDRSSNPLP